MEPAPDARRLSYLDGIRGLAALHVAAGHAFLAAAGLGTLSPWLLNAGGWLKENHLSVLVFIVLSGYCLMLPVARSGRLSGGARGFYARRAWRILPPYYAAVALCLALILFVPGMNDPGRGGWIWRDLAVPALSAGSIVSHLLLFCNFDMAWFHSIDPPLWSVAAEFQIYLLFPVFLLPLWRRFGSLGAVAGASALTVLLIVLFPHRLTTCPWLIALFACGMAAAAINFGPQERFLPRAWKTGNWGLLALVLALLFFAAYRFPNPWLQGQNHIRILDPFFGIAIAVLLVHLTGRTASGARGFLLRFLEWKPVVVLGTFSYSLYLLHFPILALVYLAGRPLHLSPMGEAALLLGPGLALAVAGSYGFHVLVERHFMPGHPHTLRQAAAAAVTSPAP